MELKNFVDFAYSLANMDEVKDGRFVIPKELIFDLGKDTHVKIHRETKEVKNETSYDNLEEEFYVDIFDITFRFKLEN